MNYVFWRCLQAYIAIAYASLLLTALGITGWSWGVACAPFWVPGALMLIVLIVVDVWHPSRDQLRALRRRWHAMRRFFGRLS